VTQVVPTSPPRRHRLLWGLLVVVVGACLAVGLWVVSGRSVPDRAPPDVALDGVDAEVARAVQKAREEVLRTPRSATAWGEFGELLHAHVFHAEALECYAQAELLDPKDARWPYHQGIIHFPDRPEEALPKLQRAAELAPEKPDAVRLRLAELLLTIGRTDEARLRFEALVQIDTNHAAARLGLARAALAAADYEGCTRHANACLGSQYARKSARAILAEMRQRQGDVAGAAAEQEKAAELPPDLNWPDPFSQTVARRKVGEKARLRHVTRLMDEGQLAEATAELRRIVADYPASAQGWMMLGYALVQQKDDAGATTALLRAIELDATSPRPHFYLGIICHRKGDRTAAVARFRDALATKPDYAMAHFNLGVTLKEDGQRAGAMQAFRDALRCQPNQAPAHAQLGEMLLHDGQRDEARTHLEHAVRLNPRDKRSAELLAGLK
jgi:tetratricopeptide (TPR) repeat protein